MYFYTLLYFTLLYFTLLYFTLLYFTLLYFTLLYFTLLTYLLYCGIIYLCEHGNTHTGTTFTACIVYSSYNYQGDRCTADIFTHVLLWKYLGAMRYLLALQWNSCYKGRSYN